MTRTPNPNPNPSPSPSPNPNPGPNPNGKPGQARAKLEDLEHASQQAHHSAGLQPTEAGVVLRWNTHKGFGFIQPRHGGGPGGVADLFCHCSDILDGA